ncbi:MAG: hypothetical protein HOV81_41210 [Kofleriaceae bacterium]|nr:hypothetical protein [Kofleriaceae bacterium]
MSVPGGPPPMQQMPHHAMQPSHQPAGPADPAKSTAIALCIAAVLVLVGTVSKSWFSAGHRDTSIHLGVMGGEVCEDGRCMDIPMDKLGKSMPELEFFALVGMLGGFAAAAAAGVFGGMTLAGKKDKLPPIKLAQIAYGIASFGMTAFFIRVIAEGGKGDVNPSWAVVPGLGGVIFAAVMTKKLKAFLPTAPAQPAGAPHGAPGGFYGQQGYANSSQPMPPQNPYANQSQPMPPQNPYANQSQPMQPYGSQQPQNPYANQSQPMQPQMAPPPGPPPAQQHACPRCGTPLQFVAQYQRWFCPRENNYV